MHISKPKPTKKCSLNKAIIYFRFNSLCILIILNSLLSYSSGDKLFATRRKVNSPTNNIMLNKLVHTPLQTMRASGC